LDPQVRELELNSDMKSVVNLLDFIETVREALGSKHRSRIS
jgi:hypothetical protein